MKLANIIFWTNIAGLLGFIALPVNAQPPEYEVKRLDEKRTYEAKRAAEEKALADFPQAKELGGQLSAATTLSACEQALEPYVAQNERRIVSYLKAHVELYDKCRTTVEVTLVKLGEIELFEKILADSHTQDFHKKHSAISKLARIKSKASYGKLRALLDVTNDGRVEGDMIMQSTSRIVMDELFSTVTLPPQGMARFDVGAWKAWFEKNRHLIE